MKTRGRNVFATVRTEGALLPPDLLQRVVDSDPSLKGLTPTEYHLPGTEKLSEAINRSWNRLLGAWAAFQGAAEKLPDNDPGTTVTREKWLSALFSELNFGRLQTTKALEIDGRTYPVSHLWQVTPIHLVGFRVDLDTKTAGVAGAAKVSPHGLVQELLNRSPDHLWGMVSNGLRLRVLRDNVSLTRQAYVEFDFEAMMRDEVYSDFALLWLLVHQSRFETEDSTPPWLERWKDAAATEGTRALETLRTGVQAAIEALGQGFLSHPANPALKEHLRSGELTTQDYYRHLLRLVYRLIFLFVAEDRGLLLAPDVPTQARERYERFYSMARLRRLAERRRGTRHPDLYEGLKLVMDKLGRDEGCAELGLPSLGSFLWSPGAIGELGQALISNADLLAAVRALAFVDDHKQQVRRVVDYRNMGSEELGSIYESLLELHPELNAEAGMFSLGVASGHERKTTGSYYTPTSLINALLDSALEPVLAEALAKSEPEAAILELKVLDPAVGSGHFLVAAAHRIAKRLAAVRTGEDEPSPEATRSALRDVISRCLYGVDVNPMAAELCKVSLWMEAMEPGKPLSFLDHHIVVGNSLLGTTPRLLAEGISDEAFVALEGDDRKVVSELKKRNKQERNGQQVLALGPSVADLTRPLAGAVKAIEGIAADSPEGLREQERRWAKLETSTEAEHAKLVADAWCAAFVIPKRKGAPVLTDGVLQLLMKDPKGGDPALLDDIRRLAEQYRFLHPHLAFPGVVRVPEDGDEPENEETGWSGGFDVVVGNPPWLSFSGRQRVEIDPGELGLMRYLFPEIAAWPSTHACFMIRGVQLMKSLGGCGFVAPLQVLHLERYGDVRGRLSGEVTKIETVDVGEEAFESVSQRVGLFSFTRGSDSRMAVWPAPHDMHGANASKGFPSTHSGELGFQVVAALADCKSFPDQSFSDPGVHTGNVSKLVVSEAFPTDDPDFAPVREGRNIAAYFCGPPLKRLWVRPQLTHGQYCTIRPREVYEGTPILLRQTADRPIACRHKEPTYFRNSVLACHGVPGLSHEVTVAILNSELLRVWYQYKVQESGQRAFPQVKVRSLRSLPLFGVEDAPSALDDLARLVHEAEAQRRTTSEPPTVLGEIEQAVCGLFQVSEDVTEKLLTRLESLSIGAQE